MSSRSYRYSKPSRRICGSRRANKFGWLLALSGSRMHFGVRTLFDVLYGDHSIA
jgi:hypothetical protein